MLLLDLNNGGINLPHLINPQNLNVGRENRDAFSLERSLFLPVAS